MHLLSNTRDVMVSESTGISLEVGQAQGPAVKGEDTLYVRGVFDGAGAICAAVFDGHGGKAASVAALKTVGDRLMDHGPPLSDALIADAFWQADQALGEAGEMSGTTATVCFLEPCDGALAGVLAWVGDSAALHVDMDSPLAQAITFATSLHNPENPAEAQRIATSTATRTSLTESMRERSHSPSGKDYPGVDSGRAECTDAQAAEALEMATGAPPSATEVCCGRNTPWHQPSSLP